MMHHIVILLVIILAHDDISVSAKSKYLNINLDAKWKSTPLILEASEFLAKESNDLFWNFVEPLKQLDITSPQFNTDQLQYDLVVKVAGTLLSPLQLNLLKFALSLRMFSPTVEMYNAIARDRVSKQKCDVFVEINNLVTCEKFALSAFLGLAANQSKPLVIKSDHYYPGSRDHDVVVILYAQLGTPQFYDWHNTLSNLAAKGQITYILRHYVTLTDDSKVRLSGYGVELAIKSTEYKAKDDTVLSGDKSKESQANLEDEMQGFRFTKLRELYPNLNQNLGEFRQHLIDSTADMAPLKVWQLQDLSYQAAQLIISAPVEIQLRSLRDISQNFPTKARSLVKVAVLDNVRREIKANQRFMESSMSISAGESALFINGIQADLDVYDVFTLVETLRSEAKLMEGLHSLGEQYNLDDATMYQLLKLDLKETESMYAVDIRDPSVIYINDLERDRKYSSWPSSVQDLLRPTFPGMLRHIRKNLFHMVLFVDPADKFCGELLKLAEAFYVHNAPVRIGFVFVVNKEENVDASKDAGVALLRAFNYIAKRENPVKALSFLTDVYDRAGQRSVTVEVAMEEFHGDHSSAEASLVFGTSPEYDGLRRVYSRPLSAEAVIKSLSEKYGDSSITEIQAVDDYSKRQESVAFYERTGLGELPQVLMNGFPLKREDLKGEFEETIVTTILRQTSELQKAVFSGFLQDNMDMFEYVMTRTNVMPRLNARILSSAEKYLSFDIPMAPTTVQDSKWFSTLTPRKMSNAIAASMNYLTKRDDLTLRPITHWVIGDFDTPEGRALLYSAIKQQKHTNAVRIGIVHNTDVEDTASTASDKFLISRAIDVALETLDVGVAKIFVTKLVKEENVESLKSGAKTLEDFSVSNMDMAEYMHKLKSFSLEKLRSHRLFCDKVLDFKSAERGLVANGKVIGPLRAEEAFIEEDFGLLEKFMMSSATGKIEKKAKTLRMEPERASDFVMKVESLLISSPQKEARRDVTLPETTHSVVRIPPKYDGPSYEVVAILDPTTRAAQKYTPLIMVLHEVANVNVTIYFNCREKLSEMPLKSFYRYVLEPELDFTEDTHAVSGPSALFEGLPLKPLLTLGMDPPESWLVESVRAIYDLDNICMDEVDNGIEGDFELEYLLLEGHCYDSMSGNPPRGLQFVLGTNSTPASVDTIVMANLGYFQLKANPGAWQLQLRHGRSVDLYDIISQDFTDSPTDSREVIVVMDSFKSKIIRLRVNKKPGKEQEDLLSEDEPSSLGLWDSISSRFTGGAKDSEDEGEVTLNIFSLASGHLYERFLRIMMLSVLDNTKSPVKFWFLKNYLSPSFKDFIPHMAKEYGFQYEMVQYKWPRWLHQQTEKQRIIWGYKILFFDVLFPLSVNKIIFVDADQTVYADLKELHDLDLEGAPYGYTPFCDSRTEMDGYRFWKSGYWQNHLGHRKYHISALYVVDLKKFRRIAAGDRLRGQYQGLSQDPNSLSNLDQDLPNNMIHQVAIKSLPQEWLWCETWCSDAEKKRAKTIDLCNNPKTKEPKLDAAMRIIPEWKGRDAKIRQLWEKVYRRDETKSDVDVSPPQTDKDSKSKPDREDL